MSPWPTLAQGGDAWDSLPELIALLLFGLVSGLGQMLKKRKEEKLRRQGPDPHQPRPASETKTAPNTPAAAPARPSAPAPTSAPPLARGSPRDAPAPARRPTHRQPAAAPPVRTARPAASARRTAPGEMLPDTSERRTRPPAPGPQRPAPRQAVPPAKSRASAAPARRAEVILIEEEPPRKRPAERREGPAPAVAAAVIRPPTGKPARNALTGLRLDARAWQRALILSELLKPPLALRAHDE
jgi:hypothetical protein